MKISPNKLSFIRIIFSLLLFFTKPLSYLFFIIYLICSISDVLDGYVARKYNLVTDFGAKLDSIADMTMFLSLIIVLLPVLNFTLEIYVLILIIVILKIASAIYCYIKFKKLSTIHSYLNKITGLLIILIPVLLIFAPSENLIAIICIIATIAAIEEFLIIRYSQYLDINCESIIKLKIK
ncbi:CDP-alcohol phosphatidyltransferase family protein [Methanobrevibacter smithii]|jgi:phosphatidylglycerophosphate synthase|uniref:CDP-alcohol phosphatidyltransferase family protein n=1 Tax=Methanobrevibacter smithii TaxID=2173 RepID=UPI00035EA3C7|nr:CDP-alcohol phosphatidyltransferase family protein [Methanobrevibacter smithii]